MSRQLELMKLHDGELTPEEVEALERQLDDDDLAVLEGLEQVGDVVRALADDPSSAADGIADSVLAELEREEAGPRLQVLPGGGKVPEPKLEHPTNGAPSLLPIIAGALAVAAAVLLWIGFANRPTEPDPVARAPETQPTAPVAPPSVSQEPVARATVEDEAAPAASIEAVDFGNQAGSIFLVPSGEQTTPVVWLVDEPTSARMEPL